MNRRDYWKWFVVSPLLLMLVAMLLPIAGRARRPASETYAIHKIFELRPDIGKALDLSGCTRSQVVAEGDCEGGCKGGILAQENPRDMVEMLPGLEGYDGDTTTVVWLYQMKPVLVTRSNDILGDDIVTIVGTPGAKNVAYYAVVPAKIVQPSIYWVYAETIHR